MLTFPAMIPFAKGSLSRCACKLQSIGSDFFMGNFIKGPGNPIYTISSKWHCDECQTRHSPLKRPGGIPDGVLYPARQQKKREACAPLINMNLGLGR